MVHLFFASAETYKVDIYKVLIESSGMVQAVMILLILMSVACWFIMGYKYIYFKRSSLLSRRFLRSFYEIRDLDRSFELSESTGLNPVSRVFREAYREMSRLKSGGKDKPIPSAVAMENLERAIRRARQEELEKAESMIPFLGTTGSTAPFIGLFGTVWGIVEAFDLIPKDDGGSILDKVAGPMAHALLATAVGLLAAIPAVMAYNFFVRKVRILSASIDGFSAEFLNLVRRHFFN